MTPVCNVYRITLNFRREVVYLTVSYYTVR